MKNKIITFLLALPITTIILFHLYQLVWYGEVIVTISGGLNYLKNYGSGGDVSLIFFILTTYSFVFTYVLIPMFLVGLIIQLAKKDS